MAWNYKGMDQEKMKKRSEMKDNRYASGTRVSYLNSDLYTSFVPRDGQNKIRILPPLEYDILEWFGMEVRFHRNVGINKDYYLCLQHMKLGACPICELQTKELWDDDPDLAKTYYPDHRVLIWVLDLLDGTAQKKPLLWSCPIGLAYDLHNVCQDPETGQFVDILHQDKGVPMFFNREGKMLRTKYTAAQKGKTALPISAELSELILPFADILIIPEYEEVKKAWNFGSPTTSARPESAPDKTAGEPEQEQEQPGGTALDAMDRDALKAFKIKHKASIKELQFTIMTNWGAEELRAEILKALAVANRMDLVVADAPEQESEGEQAPVANSADAEREAAINAKREQVRARLAAVMGKQK